MDFSRFKILCAICNTIVGFRLLGFARLRLLGFMLKILARLTQQYLPELLYPVAYQSSKLGPTQAKTIWGIVGCRT
jgi:hypothetical protein